MTMDWPASSPDLNPIENVWKLLKDNIQKRENFPRTVDELKASLREEWSKFNVSVLREESKRYWMQRESRQSISYKKKNII